MATTHEVRQSVSATPVAKETGDDGGTMAHDTIHENIRKSLGGNGTSATDGAISQGGTFTNGTSSTPYLQCTNSAAAAIGDATATFIYVKHTGYEWGGSSTVLGDATEDTILIYADSEHIATLPSRSAWIIPLAGSSSTVTTFSAQRGGSTDIAIEAIGLD